MVLTKFGFRKGAQGHTDDMEQISLVFTSKE